MITIDNIDPITDVIDDIRKGLFNKFLLELTEGTSMNFNERIYYDTKFNELTTNTNNKRGSIIYLGRAIPNRKIKLFYSVSKQITKFESFFLEQYYYAGRRPSYDDYDDLALLLLEGDIISEEDYELVKPELMVEDYANSIQNVYARETKNFDTIEELNNYVKIYNISNYEVEDKLPDEDILGKYLHNFTSNVSIYSQLIIDCNEEKIKKEILDGNLSFHYLDPYKYLELVINSDKKDFSIYSIEQASIDSTDLDLVSEIFNKKLNKSFSLDLENYRYKNVNDIADDSYSSYNFISVLDNFGYNFKKEIIKNCLEHTKQSSSISIYILLTDYVASIINYDDELIKLFCQYIQDLNKYNRQFMFDAINKLRIKYHTIFRDISLTINVSHINIDNTFELYGFAKIEFTDLKLDTLDHLNVNTTAELKDEFYPENLVLTEEFINNLKNQKVAFNMLLDSTRNMSMQIEYKASILIIDRLLESTY